MESKVDQTIKACVLEIIDDFVSNYNPALVKNVSKEITLNNAHLEGIIEGFNKAYNTKNYIKDSAYVTYDQDEGLWAEDVYIYFEVSEPTTAEQQKDQLISRINKELFFNKIFKKLINNGYRRKRFKSALLREFDNTSIYDMYVNDKDRLSMYYQTYFELIK